MVQKAFASLDLVQQTRSVEGFLLLAVAWVWMGGGTAIGSGPTTQSDPAQAVTAFVAAVGAANPAAVGPCLVSTNPDQQLLKGQLGELCGALGGFQQAMSATFGPAAAGQWGVPAAGVGPIDVPNHPAQPNQLTVVVHAGPVSANVPLLRDGNDWKLTFDGVAALMKLRQVDGLVPTDEPLRRMTDMAEAVRKVARQVRDHQYATPAAAAQAGQQAFTDAARGANAQ